VIVANFDSHVQGIAGESQIDVFLNVTYDDPFCALYGALSSFTQICARIQDMLALTE
jgi:hypothetical protein